MRIGIDCRLWEKTGVGRYIKNLVLNLIKFDNKNEYFLFVLEKDQESIKYLVSNIKYKIVPVDIRWHSFKEQIYFPIILNKYNLELMHFPYFSVPIFYFKPFVITIHDMITWQFATGKASSLLPFFYWTKQLAYRFVIFSAVFRARKIIAVSESTKKEIGKLLGVKNNKIEVILEGVDNKVLGDHQDYKKDQDKKEKLGIKEKYFLYVGNAYPHKNVESLLKSFKNLNNPNVNLVLVGKENFFYKRLKEYVTKEKINNVVFAGFISDNFLSFLYKNSTAVIIPSLSEGFGLPILEAMINKTLVTCSSIPVFKEIGGDFPYYFNPKEINEITNLLERILLIPKKEVLERLEKGYKYAQKFSWEKTAKETLKIYESCVSLR